MNNPMKDMSDDLIDEGQADRSRPADVGPPQRGEPDGGLVSALDAGGPSTWRYLQLRDSLEEAVRALITAAYGTDSSDDLFLNSRVRGTTGTYRMLASEIAR